MQTSTYSFEDHKKTLQLQLLDLDTGRSTLLYKDSNYSEPTWVSDSKFIFIKSGEKGSSSLMVADANNPGAPLVSRLALTVNSLCSALVLCFAVILLGFVLADRAIPFPCSSQEIKKFRGTISNLKVKLTSEDTVALACSALVTPSDEMYSPENEKKPHTSAKIYTSLFARHWDSWVTENRNAVFYGSLKWEAGDLKLQAPGLTNALKGTGLQSPVPPFGGAADFDISASGIVFVSRDPKLSPATHTKSDLYYVPLSSFTQAEPPMPQLVKTGKLRGYSGAPAFSHDGKSVAFTRMRHDQYESDKTRLLLVPDVNDLSNVQEFYETSDGEGGWDRRPDGILWSTDDKELYVVAEDLGRSKLFKLPASPLMARDLPEVISDIEGSIVDIKEFADKGLFISASSLTDNSFYTHIDPKTKTVGLLSSNTKQGRTFGLSRSQVSEIWFKGAGDYQVHAWVLKPSNFDPSKKYPLAMLIHGGPQSAWADNWSTRWNPAVFAEQGYIAIMPNPTGSTGYGMALENGIRENWGGRPYDDLVACYDYIASGGMGDYVDHENAVALGASYGGYMINWIQGHDLGRKFKALVCHDGVFSTLNQYASEELFFPIHDFGGELWTNREGYEKWDPARFADQWQTPQLVRFTIPPPPFFFFSIYPRLLA